MAPLQPADYYAMPQSVQSLKTGFVKQPEKLPVNEQIPNASHSGPFDFSRPSGSKKPMLRSDAMGEMLVAGLAVAIFLSSVAAAYFIYQFQMTNENTVNNALSRVVVRELASDIFELEKSLSRISAIHQSDPDMSRQTFSRLMRQSVRDIKALRSTGWAPMISPRDLSRWIEKQKNSKRELLTYQTIRALQNFTPLYLDQEQRWSKRESPATERAFIQNYLAPILYVEDELGKVLNSAEHFAGSISEATRTGAIKASQTQMSENNKLSSTLFYPVYSRLISPGQRRDLHSERERLITGVLNFQLDIVALLQASLIDLDEHALSVSITEVSAESADLLLFKSQDGLFDEEQDIAEEVDFFGNTWVVRVHREPLSFIIFLPSALVLLVGFIIASALMVWHSSNIQFKRRLNTKLAKQKREITQKTGLLEAVLDAAPIGIEYIDENGTTELQNNLAKICAGSLTAQDAINSGEATLVSPPEDLLVKHFQLETGTSDDREHFEIISKALAETTDIDMGNIVVSSNVTEREVAKKKLESYISELETINRELEEFTYSATHDMQEPLRRIASFSEILEEHITDGDLEDAKEITTRLISSSKDLRQRFSQIVDEIDNRNRRRAQDNNLSFLESATSNKPDTRD